MIHLEVLELFFEFDFVDSSVKEQLSACIRIMLNIY